VAWPGYTIDQFGRVYRVDEPLEISVGPKGDFVMLGAITPGGRVSTDKTKRYISDLLRSTWPEIQEKDDVLLLQVVKSLPKNYLVVIQIQLTI
jgi:hypothetical protein